MAIEKPAPWTGASGAQYVFYVFGLTPDVPARLGNYVYAKRNADGAWVPVYIGHGDLSVGCTDAAVRRCIETKAATHLHLRLNGREADRDAELRDLLAHYANAFAPEGCHAAAPTGRAAAERTPAAKAAPRKASSLKEASPPKKATAGKSVVKKAAAPKSAAKQQRTRSPSK